MPRKASSSRFQPSAHHEHFAYSGERQREDVNLDGEKKVATRHDQLVISEAYSFKPDMATPDPRRVRIAEINHEISRLQTELQALTEFLVFPV